MTRLVPASGPKPAQIILLGEAPGTNEVLYKRPFVGEAGDELTRMLEEAGIDRASCYITNVFKCQPPDNNVEHFFTTRSDPEACRDIPTRNGKYLREEFRAMVNSTRDELASVGATLVIALGATALWHCLGQSKISAYVGTLHAPVPDRRYSVLPTFHPAAVLRQWSYRSIVVANLLKAKDFLGQAQSNNPANPSRGQNRFSLKINPTLHEVKAFARRVASAPEMAVDIETARGQIRTIAFCTNPRSAFCIPFWEPPSKRYWPDNRSEVEAWNCVRQILSNPECHYIFHNGAFDLQYLWRGMGIPTRGHIEDTMLMHHALELELPKGLGPLAATYLSIPEWKTKGHHSEKDEE